MASFVDDPQSYEGQSQPPPPAAAAQDLAVLRGDDIVADGDVGFARGKRRFALRQRIAQLLARVLQAARLLLERPDRSLAVRDLLLERLAASHGYLELAHHLLVVAMHPVAAIGEDGD